MEIKKIENNKRLLFALDLDGTTLSHSDTAEIHPVTLEAIKRAVQEGHIVSIITGRPWRSTQPIYKKLGLNTPVGNYNGAYVHHPANDFFIPIIKYVHLNEMLYILGDEKVKDALNNIAFEGPGWVQLQQRDPLLEKIFGFDSAIKFKIGLDLNKLPLKPTGVICDTKKGVDIIELRRYLQRKFGDLAEFNFWSKGPEESYVFDISAVGVSKSRVISTLIRFYDIKLSNTISFGDAFNDMGMFDVTNISIAMKNAEKQLIKKATIHSEFSNKDGGVGHYINRILDDPEKYIEMSKEVRRIRHEQNNQ